MIYVENRWSCGFVDVLKMGWRERRNSLCTHISSLETFHSVCEHRQTVHSAEPMPTHALVYSRSLALSLTLRAELSCAVLRACVCLCYTRIRSNVCCVLLCESVRICWWRGRLCVHRGRACVCECLCVTFRVCYMLSFGCCCHTLSQTVEPLFHTRAHSFRSLSRVPVRCELLHSKRIRDRVARERPSSTTTQKHIETDACALRAHGMFSGQNIAVSHSNKLSGLYRCVHSSLPLFSNTRATTHHVCFCISVSDSHRNHFYRVESASYAANVSLSLSSSRSDMLGYLFIYSILCAFSSLHLENWNVQALETVIMEQFLVLLRSFLKCIVMQWWTNVCFISNNSQSSSKTENSNCDDRFLLCWFGHSEQAPWLEWNDAAGHIMYKDSMFMWMCVPCSYIFFDFHVLFPLRRQHFDGLSLCEKNNVNEYSKNDGCSLCINTHTHAARLRANERISYIFLCLQMNGWRIIHESTQTQREASLSLMPHQSKNGSLVVIFNTWYKSLFNAIITTTIESPKRTHTHSG